MPKRLDRGNRRFAEPANIVANDAIAIRQDVELRVPHPRVQAQPVDEHHRVAPTCNLVVEPGAVDVRESAHVPQSHPRVFYLAASLTVTPKGVWRPPIVLVALPPRG